MAIAKCTSYVSISDYGSMYYVQFNSSGMRDVDVSTLVEHRWCHWIHRHILSLQYRTVHHHVSISEKVYVAGPGLE